MVKKITEKRKPGTQQIFSDIKGGRLQVFDKSVLSEATLKSLAGLINESPEKNQIVKELISRLPNYGRSFDWNVGSTVQHLEVELLVDALKTNKSRRLLDSIGLAWALGEFNNTNRVITDFLYEIVRSSSNSDAWWRAAFSLEKLGLERAVNLLKMSLKTTPLKNLDYYLERIHDKKSVISILILSNVENIERVIYPHVKKTFLGSNDNATIINCCWLIGRLRLIDSEIYSKLITLISHKDYELRYYTFFALQNNATEPLRPTLERSLGDGDPLIRKMAARGLMSIGSEQSLTALERALYKEPNEAVVAELSRTIYHLKNPTDKATLLLEMGSYKNENGMISDESDKWYHDPAIYRIFSEAEDPENICFLLILDRIKGMAIKNPTDLATGTGRMVWQIIDKIKFTGSLFALDISKQMCDFMDKTIRRERRFTNNVKIVNTTIVDAPESIKEKSTLVISSFGFPSKISDSKLCIEELKAVYAMLDDGGLFFTIGWDETFNDELNQMWFKFIPDNIVARDFEEWRKNRAAAIKSPRNANLSWLKRGIAAPLQFSSLKESALVMGYLFGCDAAQYIISSGKTEWGMSLGITCNTKEELKKIIKSYERS